MINKESQQLQGSAMINNNSLNSAGTSFNLIEVAGKLEDIREKCDGRILIVDDEQFCLAGLNVIIKQIGIDVANKVDLCLSALEALECLKNANQLGLSYKLIITDI